jgi:hypothetical protein
MDKFGTVYENDVVIEKPVYFNKFSDFTEETRFEGQVSIMQNPVSVEHAVNKGYVDNLVGDIETALTNIEAIQDALIGGNV